VGPVAVTLAAAAAVLLLGRALHRAFPALARWDIPEPVSGGMVVALGALALHLAGVEPPAVAREIREPMLLAFFAAVGLQADLGALRAGGARLARFAALTVAFILVQNLMGIGLAILLGLDPLIGLLAGSVTLVGGHGTGAAFGALFAERYGLDAALEIALACATLGIVLGGLLAGPAVRGLAPAARQAPPRGAPPPTRSADLDALAPILALILLCVAGAMAVVPLARMLPITLPDFLWAVALGAALRNLVLAPLGRLPEPGALDVLSGLFLGLFLALAMASLRLWEVLALAAPLLLLLAAQTLLTLLWTRLVCFRAMGRDAPAAAMSAGFFGFAIGSTATAVATMREIERATRPMPEAVLIVSLTAGLFVTLANALLLGALLALPVFAR
jgi:ESS family glutamate:Na+ symporter